MDNPSVRTVFRITLPHDGYGEIRAGHVLDGIAAPLPPGVAVVLEVGAGFWCRDSELERVARSLEQAAHISVTGTDLRQGGADDISIVTGLDAIARRLARHLASPALFQPA